MEKNDSFIHISVPSNQHQIWNGRECLQMEWDDNSCFITQINQSDNQPLTKRKRQTSQNDRNPSAKIPLRPPLVPAKRVDELAPVPARFAVNFQRTFFARWKMTRHF